jgi:hypothetical protein
MKTIPLRQLLREPGKVKRLTRAGQAVQISDSGKPLWIVQPAAVGQEQDEERARAIDEVLDEVQHSPPSKISLGKVLDESRR